MDQNIDVVELADQVPVLNSLSDTLQGFVLQLVLFVIILAVVWLMRGLITRILFAPIKGIVSNSKSQLDDALFEAIQRPVNLVIIAIAVTLTTTILDFGTEIQVLADVVARVLLIAALMFTIYNLVDIIMLTPSTLRRITRIEIKARLLPFMRTVAKIFILVMGLLIIIQEFGYDVGGLIASLGIVGLAFSLAAQDTAANVFGFTAIVGDNPFEVGDYIVLSDGLAGVVEHVGVRSTRIRKLDQSLVTMPNNKVTENAVTNWSRLSKRRLDFIVGLTYETTSAQMREFTSEVKSMLRSLESVDPDSIVVHFVAFNDSSLDVRIICYVKIADWNAYTAETEVVNLEILDIVERLGLSIAFPSRALYVQNTGQPERGADKQQDGAPHHSGSTFSKPAEMPDQANDTAADDQPRQ